jgi:hypothetical protein
VDDETDLAGHGGPAPRWHGLARRGGMAATLVAALLVSLLTAVDLASPRGDVARAEVPHAAGAAASGGALVPVAAPATTSSAPPAVVAEAAPGDARIDVALGLISFPWQERLPGWQVSFLGRDDAYYGMTLVEERRIEVYVRQEQTPADIAGVLAHELGHAVDVTLLCWRDRYEWLTSRGQAPTARWYVGDGASDFESGAGDFAEAFAVWQVGRDSWSRLAGDPSPSQVAHLAQLATTAAPADGRC